MSLKTYLKSLTPAEREAFAKACDTSLGQLNQVAWGYRRAGESLAINIERESGGKVTCEQLRPDVDWAYLRNTKPKKSRAA
jgi:DNA-binding transcriptional regulator YdaS (Cro superfamily)